MPGEAAGSTPPFPPVQPDDQPLARQHPQVWESICTQARALSLRDPPTPTLL